MLKLVYLAAFVLTTAVAGVMMVYAAAASCPAAGAVSAFALTISATWVGWTFGARHSDSLRESLHYDVMHSSDLMNMMIKYNKLKVRVQKLYASRNARINRTGPQQVVGKYRIVERALP